MFSILQAKGLFYIKMPDRRIEKVVEYGDLFIFLAPSTDPDEGDFDPFFSVNKETGEVRDFSILTDGDFDQITELFSSN